VKLVKAQIRQQFNEWNVSSYLFLGYLYTHFRKPLTAITAKAAAAFISVAVAVGSH